MGPWIRGGWDERYWATHLAPGYAVPARFTVREDLPLSANGKVDRAALAELVTAGGGTPHPAPPEGPVEVALAELWGELLDEPVADRDANFLILGGHSLLLLLRLISPIQEQYGVAVPARHFPAARRWRCWRPNLEAAGVPQRAHHPAVAAGRRAAVGCNRAPGGRKRGRARAAGGSAWSN
jgi:hypothetical protein